VAPGPASGEDASLQVGPESDCWLDRCSCAHVAAITADPPMAIPTAMPAPTANWPMTIVLNVTIGPCAGVPRVAALVLKNLPFQIPVTAPRKRAICASGVVVFSALGNRRAGCMTCGPGPPSWTVGCSEAEGAHNRATVARSFFGSVCMTCGAWPPCHKVRSLALVGGNFDRDASGARVGGSAF
jgi:hypothetical protein